MSQERLTPGTVETVEGDSPPHRSMPARARLASALNVAAPLAAVLALIAGLLVFVGANPLAVLDALVQGATGTPRSIGESLLRAAPLLLIAVTLAPSLRARLFNLGAPGQMALGAAAATGVALSLPTLPGPVLIILGALAAALAGVLGAVVPAFMKARWNINEIITTIALNFLAFYFVQFLVSGPWQSDFASIPQSDPIDERAWLPIAIEGTRAHWGLALAVVAVVALFLIDRTRFGYRQKLFASNPSVSRLAGVRPQRTVFTVMVTAGLGAGLAGWLQVAGVDHRLYATVSDPVGYAGLFVALLGATRPWGMLVAAVLLGGLLQGGQSLQIGVGLSPEIVQVFIGLVLLGYAVASRNVGRTHE